MKELLSYLEEQLIPYEVVNAQVVKMGGESFILTTPTEGKLFDDHFRLIADLEAEGHQYIYKFGGVWYHTPKDDWDNPTLTRVRDIGKAVNYLETDYFLGIHSTYEMLNGLGLYKDWIKRAKFLGVKALAICEKNSLAGALKFQIECKNNGIKSIIGASYTVYRKADDYKYDVKCYVKNEKGWYNLLMINKEVNVINQKYIEETVFNKLQAGLFIVYDPKSIDFDKLFPIDISGRNIYYQLDTVEYEEDKRDKEYLLNLKKFVRSNLHPIAITDAYYVNREDAYLRVKLNAIAENRDYKSENQYFKSKDDYYLELSALFRDPQELDNFFVRAISNEMDLAEACRYEIDQEGKHLPDYHLLPEQISQFGDKSTLFWSLIEEGLAKAPEDRIEAYLARVEKEVSVIELGGFVDYFLILWDIIKWSNERGILTGIGRGSAGGSLVAYLLGITRVNPLDFGLIFERFLNEGRVGKSLPDIDVDFCASRRDEVKHYMEERFGASQVCSIGTYSTMKLKSSLKDFARLEGIDIQLVEYMTAIIEEGLDEEKYTGSDNTQIFKSACQVPRLKAFIQDHSNIINDALKVLNSPRAQSVHACATLIVPDKMDIYNWIPVKNMSTKTGEVILVSEWEGTELDTAGFLKEDILGIKQLDKFATILDLVSKNHAINVDIYNLPLEDELVFRYFRKGWNQDVFHFGAKGLAQYCKQAQPEHIEDLITIMSLYRPGPIESNLHKEFILRKLGDKEVEYLWGAEGITKETYGVLVYQEQIMQTCVSVGGFSLVEADDIRKALGKKKRSIIDGYKDQFIAGAESQGCPKEEAEHIWEQMEKFASYSFNKSHAAAYTLTGYASQYLKVHFPIEYWTAAFEYVATDQKKTIKIPRYMSEIYKTGAIKLSPPDVNNSHFDVHSNLQANTIYWGVTSIKQVGGIAAEQLIKDREEKGKYFSFEEFLARHLFKGSKVNKTHIEHLVICGAFDNIENITNEAQRYKLIKYYRETNKVKVDATKDLFTLAGANIYADWWWQYQQKLLCGLAYFDFADLSDKHIADASYLDQDNFQSNHLLNRYYCTGGFVSEVRERASKKKGTYCTLVIESNYEFLTVNIFPEKFKELTEGGIDLLGCKDKLVVLSGIMKFDDRLQENTMKVWDSSEVIILE